MELTVAEHGPSGNQTFLASKTLYLEHLDPILDGITASYPIDIIAPGPHTFIDFSLIKSTHFPG